MANRDEIILLVDDEENVLSSLRRLLHPDGYDILTATSAEEGLTILENSHVALIISDNAMPGISGVEFLGRVRDRWPDRIRILLTGYANLDAAIEAINNGEVYRFVTKPWDPDGLRSVVRQGIDQYLLVEDNRRMHSLIKKQNAVLKRWNVSLQKTVEERTENIRQKNDELERLYAQLKNSFVNTIKVFTGLIEHRNPTIGGHVTRVARLAEAAARHMQLTDETVGNVEVAALLHDIGKISLPDDLLRREQTGLSTAHERAILRQHAILGQAALQIIDSMDPIGLMVRHHHERWDGKGYPDGLSGDEISTGSLIIAVANAFDHFQENKSRDPADFFNYYTKAGHGGAFSPLVVAAFRMATEELAVLGSTHEIAVSYRELREGMVVSQDVKSFTGMLLIPKGEPIKLSYIEKLIQYESQKLVSSTITVYA